MKRLFLLAICLSFAALAETRTPMWQRNNGAWEAVVRVSKDEPYWEFGDFRAVTNCVQSYYTSVTTTTAVWRVDYDRYIQGNDGVVHQTWHVYTSDVDECTNRLASAPYYNATFVISFAANRVTTVVTPHNHTVELPCRFGVPATITVDAPYTDLLEMLPLDYQETFIRVRTGFDGYLLIRLDEAEMRLTIKRLLPEKLPYERTPQNIRVSVDDLLYGV